MEPKRLYRSVKNKVLCGVCGGIGEYLQVDPVMIRLIWVLLMLLQSWRHLFQSFMGFSLVGGSLVLYIIAAVIIPQAPKDETR
ncbi:PspC domain-containing protein [Lacrimispora saccharolytica]|uniref:Phage shock protein C, PspC n=1 Tax=Lacrimispora saccharolytica (strain ATCC 35040 / DSM 2544 / NRCC 2533 / WM1) TaxID=610130 RepID=D9R4C4_LACSW|nr:PspC domain-containing protein [Lacrimispora saccharolytica]ADL04994.1 phage shock protein C, PspC [[Clostridium] saccharolyticum WM1]QRV20804.1 PspC domain-containing protein [Lacrimispora saccharolytica]